MSWALRSRCSWMWTQVVLVIFSNANHCSHCRRHKMIPVSTRWPLDQEQVTHAYVIQHPEKWSRILWNCAKQKFVSCTSNWLGQMFCFQTYTRHLLRLILLSPQGRQQSLSLGTNPVCNAVLCSLHDNTVDCLPCDEYRKSALPVFCDWSRKLVCWPQDVRSSISCQIQAFQDNLWANFWQVSNWFKFHFLEMVIIKARIWNFEELLFFLFASPQHLTTHFFACPSISCDHATVIAWGFSHPGNFRVAPAEVRDSNIFVYFSKVISFGLHSRWVHPKVFVITKWSWFVKINAFHPVLPRGSHILLSSSHFLNVIHVYWRE